MSEQSGKHGFDHPPAFPTSGREIGSASNSSLRDYLAGQALAGLCANPGGPFQRCESSGWTMVNCNSDHVARQCYELADAMLAEREKVG